MALGVPAVSSAEGMPADDALCEAIVSLSPSEVACTLTKLPKISNTMSAKICKIARKRGLFCIPSDSPLMLACSLRAKNEDEHERQLSIVAMLIACGLDINCKNRDGRTCLVSSLDSENPRLAAFLLRMGADPNVRFSGTFDGPARLTPLHIAAQNNIAVNELIMSGANVNATDSIGWTPLHAAAICSSDDPFRLLTAAGADEVPAEGTGTPSEIRKWNRAEMRRRRGDTDEKFRDLSED